MFENGLGALSGPFVAPPVYCGVKPVDCVIGSLSRLAIEAGYRVSKRLAVLGVMPPVLNIPSVIAAECSATFASSIGFVPMKAEDEADEKDCCACLMA